MTEEKDQPIIDVEQAYSKTEQYIIENKQSLSIIAGAIIVLVGGYFAWKKLYIEPEDQTAKAEMYKAEQYFEQDSFDLAINGNATFKGFSQIIEDYGATPSGNLAHYYLGISYLKKGEYENAIEHLEEFDADDQMIAPIATGAIGDAQMELGKVDDAISHYIKAAEQSKNGFTSPIFLKKAAMAYEEKANYNDAIKIYERIRKDFPKSNEGKDMDKYIARAQVLAGI